MNANLNSVLDQPYQSPPSLSLPLPSTQPEIQSDLREILLLMESYVQQMRTHPLQLVFRDPSVPRQLVLDFAGIQYADSVLWVPMLAIMKDRAQHPTLVQALLDNLMCEAGAHHESHVMLCQRFLKSLGVSPYFGDYRQYSDLARHPIEIMNGVSGMSECQIAGFNLMSEAMVPHLFKMALPAFQRIPGADCQYLTDHISVDADDHAAAMIRAVQDLILSGSSVGEILEGMHLSGRTSLSIPDALYAQVLRGHYQIQNRGQTR
jgi:pyrroloquinoline quinone (PQQ) biosynthesis protein C